MKPQIKVGIVAIVPMIPPILMNMAIGASGMSVQTGRSIELGESAKIM